MKDDFDKNMMIGRFLNGEMDIAEIAEFEKRLMEDPEFRTQFDAASAFEGLLAGSNKERNGSGRFEELMKRSLSSVTLPIKSKGAISWQRLYAIAATFIMVIMGGYIFRLNVQHEMPANTATVKDDGKHPAKKQPQGKSIMRLTPSTLFLAEEGTKSQIIRQPDSSITVMVSQGNICFDVHGQNDRPITIATPHSAITLRQSVTRVVVTELETEVSVLEGSAEVIHRYNHSTSGEYAAGNTLYADYTTFTLADALAKNVCDSRKSIFRAYVAWVQKQANG